MSASDDRIRLRSLIRTEMGNCFVRLAPSIAARLGDAALPTDSSLWSGSYSTLVRSGVEFLPLKIEFFSGDVVFASYNGGDLLTDDADPCIEIPSSLLPDGYSEDSMSQVLTVEVLDSVECATQLFVEPDASEDWDLLELDASWLEEGGLLQQISVVYANQVVPLKLSNRTDVAHIRVLPRNFEERSVWPDGSTASCLRLLSNTEVIIAPKTRAQPLDSCGLNLIATLPDYWNDRSMLELAEWLGLYPNLVNVAQNTAAVHPSTFAKMLPSDLPRNRTVVAMVQLAASQTTDGTYSEVCVVALTTSELVREDCLALHPLARLKIKASIVSSQVTIKLLSPFETSKISSIVPELIRLGKARLSLRPTQLKFTERIRSWRAPDTLEHHNHEFVSFATRIEPRAPPNNELLDLPITPLQIGGFISLPWTNVMGEERLLYQLVLDSEKEDLESSGRELRFVFARDLARLLSDDHPDPSVYPHIIECPCPSVLARTLPERSFFPTPLLALSQTAARRPFCLLYGDRGSGKTHSALSVAAVARLAHGHNTVYLNCKKLRDSRVVRMTTVLDDLSKLLEDALAATPCVVILDDLDEIAFAFGDNIGSDDSMQTQQINPVEIDQSKLVADFLRGRLLEAELDGHAITVVATCRTAESLPTSLLNDGGFVFRSAVPLLGASDREALYRNLLQRQSSSGTTEPSYTLSLCEFGRKSVGFRPRDLEQLAARVCKRVFSPASTNETMEAATAKQLEAFVPLTRLGAVIEETSASTCWADVGGLFRAKAELQSTILQPSMYRRIYERSKIRLPRGILLYGFPGCGKTMCVPALAKECGFPLIMCRGPELLDKYIGASEAKVRELFSRAASAAPSIIFIDELDALAPRRGADHTGVTDRVVNQLLTFLDGVEDNSLASHVYVIAATSRPDKVDPALLRPGRLEKHVYFGMVEELEELTDVMTKIARGYELEPAAREWIGTAAQESLHDNSQLSAADLKAMFNAAQLAAMHEALALGRTDDVVSIKHEHLVHAFRARRPSLSSLDFAHLKEIYSVYRHEPSTGPIPDLPRPPLKTALK